VENLAVLHELAKTNSATILASSGSEGGFAHSAIIEFLQQLPERVVFWHCGDTDPKGFDILRHLRERTGRTIRSLAMEFDGSQTGPRLTETDRKTIARLLDSPLLVESEKAQLTAMQAAGHKGVFEQEARPLPGVMGPTTPKDCVEPARQLLAARQRLAQEHVGWEFLQGARETE
jgi:hypothetical protein